MNIFTPQSEFAYVRLAGVVLILLASVLVCFTRPKYKDERLTESTIAKISSWTAAMGFVLVFGGISLPIILTQLSNHLHSQVSNVTHVNTTSDDVVPEGR